jgi:hypothetical protein
MTDWQAAKLNMTLTLVVVIVLLLASELISKLG